jgi:malate dehydrogenase
MKVTIAGGGGGVGASLAANLLRTDAIDEIVLVDARPAMVTSHLMDLEQARLLGGRAIVSAGEIDAAFDADLLVLTAGAPQTVNTSRLAFLSANAEILRAVVDGVPHGWPGVILVVTNPVDPLIQMLFERLDIDRGRLVGYTLNDSLRMRSGVGLALTVDPLRVDAWVIGEHGDACVPLWDRICVDGEPVQLDADQQHIAEDFLRNWYIRHVALDSGRTSTWTSGRGVARMVEAIATGADGVWPASIMLDGEYGEAGVALSVPVRLGPGGLQAIETWTLTDEQARLFARAGDVVREAAAAIQTEAA